MPSLDAPVISVLMPAYNAAGSVAKTITSVLDQTFEDFEFIIVNDGSIDDTKNIIEGFEDDRIKLLNNSENMGIVSTLNKGLDYCRGKYICRIDADDICHKKRFIYQYNFMEKNPDCIVSGTHYKKIINNKVSRASSKHFFSVNNEELRIRMLRNNPIGHSTVMFRKKLITNHGLKYDSKFQHCEDYALWFQAMKYGEIHIINRPLVYYRQHDDQISKKHSEIQCQNANKIRETLIRELVPELSAQELVTHFSLMTHFNSRVGISNEAIYEWVNKVCEINNKKKLYDKALFERFMKRCQKRFIKQTMVSESDPV